MDDVVLVDWMESDPAASGSPCPPPAPPSHVTSTPSHVTSHVRPSARCVVEGENGLELETVFTHSTTGLQPRSSPDPQREPRSSPHPQREPRPSPAASTTKELPGRRPRADSSAVPAEIMFYSPDIPLEGAGGRGASERLATYYERTDAEESVKCVASTALFVLVLVVFVIVTLLLNPQM